MSDRELRELTRAPWAGDVDALVRSLVARVRAGEFDESPAGDIPAELDDSDWESAFDECGFRTTAQTWGACVPGSGVRETPFSRADVRLVLGTSGGEPDGDDWLACVALWDGRYAAVSAGCDYSGWG